MGKGIQWLGPWEDIKDDQAKFEKMCVLSAKPDKKAAKNFSSAKPDKLVLFSFITNPRGLLMPIGEDVWGYHNTTYLTWWQITAQQMWSIVNQKLSAAICPIVPLKEAADAGLYGDDSLPEQFPGTLQAPGFNFIDYPQGGFDVRDYGGWKWFGLVVDEDKWDKTWSQESMPDMGMKEKIKHKAAPKYYKSYFIKGNVLVESDKSNALYATPKGVRIVNRRYCWPFVVGVKSDNTTATRYENAFKIINDKLGTKWTLAVWNGINFAYASDKKSTSLIIKPEITLSIGRFSDNADGKKGFGNQFAHLHRHWEGVYNVKVGLNDKTMINLVTHVKKEVSPVWDGSYQKVWDLMSDAYVKLLDLGISTLKSQIQ